MWGGLLLLTAVTLLLLAYYLRTELQMTDGSISNLREISAKDRDLVTIPANQRLVPQLRFGR